MVTNEQIDSTSGPAGAARNITPSDTEDILINGHYPRGFRCKTGGDIDVMGLDDQVYAIEGAQDGEKFSFAHKRIMDTNTTASGFLSYR